MIYFVHSNMVLEKNSYTELAALELLDRVLGQMDKHKIPINFHIDLSKAFDSLRHDILLDKLSNYYGITYQAKKLTARVLLKQSKTVCSDWQHKVHNEASFHWSSIRFDCWSQARQTRQNSGGMQRASQDSTKGGGGCQIFYFLRVKNITF